MVNVPPGSRDLDCEMLLKRVIWNVITGSSHAPDEASVCQNGSAPEEAIDCHPRPSKPETGDWRRPLEMVSQRAAGGGFLRGIPSKRGGRESYRRLGLVQKTLQAGQ